MTQPRLYSDQEISAILKRAGELQAKESDAETHGLSLEELQHIAAEVGLDPKLIERAAAQLEHKGSDKKGVGLWGSPTSIHIERVMQGEIAEHQWADVAGRIGDAFGMVGRSGQVGQSLEWTHTSERANLQITATPCKGQTKVRVVGKFTRVALAYFLPALIVGGVWGTVIPLAMQVAPAFSFAIGMTLAIAAYWFARLGYGRYIRKKEQAVDKLIGKLEQLIEAEADLEAPSEKVAVAVRDHPRIDLPDGEETEDLAPGSIRKKTR